MLIGYARTSTVEQQAGLDSQRRDLCATGCTKIFEEQVSSISTRQQLKLVLDFCREGDTLVVTKLDRLARSTVDLLRIVQTLDEKSVGLRICDFGGTPVDTKSPSGKLLLTVFGAIAEFERGVMLQRQKEGIAAAKAQGKYKGRKPTARIRQTEVSLLYSQGIGAAQIAKTLGIGRASVYRMIPQKGSMPVVARVAAMNP